MQEFNKIYSPGVILPVVHPGVAGAFLTFSGKADALFE